MPVTVVPTAAQSVACRDYLTANGVEVKMSRIKDEDDCTNQEVAESNAFNPDVAVSIHNNAGGGDGVEVYSSVVGGVSKTLADNILAEVVKIGQNSRGVKQKKGNNGSDYFGFIRMTKAPAVIVECAFVDNATDILIIATELKRKRMGTAIAKGILKTLGINEAAAEPVPSTTTKYKTVTDIAREVLAGKWGNGSDRKKRLTAAGYNYNEVQKAVNTLSKTPVAQSKSVTEVAKEVVAGKWGNGSSRKKRLEAAGYNYKEVQKAVNALLK